MKNWDNFEENKKNGCFQIARSLFDSDIWIKKPAWWAKVWIYILGRAHHSDDKLFKRGEFFSNFQEIYYACNLGKEGIKIRTVDNVIRELKLVGMITTQKTTRGIIIKVVNYNKYQTLDNYKNDTKNKELTTEKRQRNDTIDKNYKELKNYKDIIVQLSKIFNYKVSYNKTVYSDVNRLFKRFKTKDAILAFAKQANSFEEYPYIIHSPGSLYKKIDKITARLEKQPKSEQETLEDVNNKVKLIKQKYDKRNT